MPGLTISSSYIKTRVEKALIDPDNERWTEAELLMYLQEAILHIVNIRPECNTEIKVHQLAGGSKQTIKTAGGKLLRVIAACNALGSICYNTVSLISKERLDRLNPSWIASSATTTPKAYMVNPNSATTFFVFPPAAEGGALLVEMTVAVIVPEEFSEDHDLPIDESFVTPIIDFMLHRAYQKDAGESPEAANLSQMYLGNFYKAIESLDRIYSQGPYSARIEHS